MNKTIEKYLSDLEQENHFLTITPIPIKAIKLTTYMKIGS